MLDNGYVYLAAARLSLFRSDTDWAVVFEVFGFSPRAGMPDTSVTTIASEITNRKTPEDYATPKAFQAYLDRNPFWDQYSVSPIENDDWLDPDTAELARPGATLILRGQPILVPDVAAFKAAGITPSEVQPTTFETCRYLAHHHREQVLCSQDEIRHHIPVDMTLLAQFDDWHHPDLAGQEPPSRSVSVQRIAIMLTENRITKICPAGAANTHWRNWPDGGTL
jgi:hypothetical protein